MNDPYYQDDHVTIFHGDCRDVLTSMAPTGACVVTSPPYNTLGTRVATPGTGMLAGSGWLAKVNAVGYADDMTEDAYTEWQQQVAAVLSDACKPGASFFYNHKVRYRGGSPVHPIDIVRTFADWHLKQEIIWARDGGIAFNARMFCPSDERIYWLTKPGAKYTWNQSSACDFTVWKMRQEIGVSGHPCPYPIDLPTRCIAATTVPGDTVIEPFLGSGTTLRAAKSLGRKAIGIELDERYCEIAAKRCAQEVLDFGA